MTMSPAALTAFIEELEKYRLLEPEQLKEVARLKSGYAHPRALAKELLARGWISPYQANLVLTGRGQELLLGSYVLLERIGEGGMGQVFKARNWKMGRVVALKVIRQERLTHPTAVRRFEREIRAAAQLHHPNVVQTIDADQVQDTHLMVMELVEGGRDLNQLVKEQGPLPVGRACDFMRQAALGLAHAFERGMVHRDIKPHNLLVSKDGVLKILDMGLARMLDDGDEKSSQLTLDNTVVGTPDFIAPEQALNSHGADIRADLYSLGCVFFYVLAGRVPFGGDTLTEKLLRHQTDPPPKIEEIRPEVPEAISRVIYKLLAKKPEDRYQTPGELAQVLESFLRGESVEVRLADSPSGTMSLTAANPFVNLGSDETTDMARPEAPAPAKAPARIYWLFGAAAACVVGLMVMIVLSRKGTPEPLSPSVGKVKAVLEPTRVWQDTGIDLDADTAVAVTVQGKLKKKDWPECTPAGLESQPRDRNVLFDVPPLCLLGRIGEQDPFPLGTVSSIRPKEAGRLFVQFNDLDLRDISGKATLEMNPARSNSSLGKRPGPVRIQAAESAVETLAANLARGPSPADLAKLLQEFRDKYDGTPAMARASMLWHAHLAGLPSPLDNLDAVNISTEARELWRDLDPPKELVAVFGEAGAWPAKCLAFSGAKPFLLRAIEEKADLLDAISGKEVHVFETKKKILALGLSADGDLAAAATQASDLLLWNPHTGTPAGKLVGHKGAVNSVQLSFDGKQALSGGQDGTVRLWDVTGKKEMRRWEGFRGSVLRAALSPDGRVVAAAGQDLTVRFWNPAVAADEGLTARGYVAAVSALAFSPDGWTLATAHINGLIKFWDLAGKEPKERSVGVAIGGINPVLAYSPDGRWLLAGSQSGTLILWDAGTQKKLWEWKLPAAITGLAFAADSRHVALGLGNGVVAVFRFGLPPPPDPELAESTYQNLLTRAADPSANPDQLLRDVARFRGRFAGLPQADKAAALFWKLPSPLDRLDPANIPEIERLPWQPKELVAVLGSHRLHHVGGVARVALSPDGKTLATGTMTGQIILWDAVTGKESKRLGSLGAEIIALAFHKDSRLLAAGARDGAGKLIDVVTGKTVHSLKEKTPLALAFSPDGKVLAAGEVGNVVLRDVKSWKVLQTLKGEKDQILALAFSADSEMLASGSQDGAIVLWDVKQAKLLKTIAQKEGPVIGLAFHPEKKLLASAANTVKLWDLTANLALKTWPGGQAVSFDKSGNLLAFPSGNSIKLWDLAKSKLSELKAHLRPVRSVVFGDGKLLASCADDQTARLWDVAAGKETVPVGNYADFPIAFSPDGRSLVSFGQGFHGPELWDLATLKSRILLAKPYAAHALAVSPDGTTLATGNWAKDTRLLLWDTAKPGQYLVALGHKSGIMQTAFSPGGRKVASCGGDNTVHFWDPFTGKQVDSPLLGHFSGINCVAYSPDGRWLATGSTDGTARLWDLRARTTVHTFTEHGKASVRALAFSKKGDLLATLGTDQKVHIWEVAKRELRHTLDAPPGTQYWTLAVSPDDRLLATSSNSGAIYLWDLQTGKKLKEWKLPVPTRYVAFAPDTRHLAVAVGNGTVYILRLSKGPEKARP